MESFDIIFDLADGRHLATVEKRKSPPQYIVYFKEEAIDLKFGQIIYEVKDGQLVNNDEKSLNSADLTAQIGLEIKNYLQENNMQM